MAFRRSNRFNPNVDEALLSLIEKVGGGYGPYDVEVFSGYRPGDPRFHGKGAALDVNLINRETGKALANYQSPETAQAYQQFANAVYRAADPELQKRLRWGGYFGGGPGKYGALDLMHFDVGGDVGMAGGSWAGGWTPEMMKTWGLKNAGGLEQLDAEMQAAGYTPEQRRAAIASIESSGESDPYRALGKEIQQRTGPDRAYGRYQVMGSNIPAWTKQVLGREMTPEQFLADPKAQDAVFDAIFGADVAKYGERGAASKWFTGSPNEPARSDIHGKLTGGTYADRYMAALRPPGGPVEAAGGGAGSDAPYKPTATTVSHPPNPTVGAPAAKTPEPWWKRIGKAMTAEATNFGTGGGATPAQLPPTPGAAVTQLTPVAPINPQQQELQRQQLALALARLNQGTLWG